VVGGPGAGRWRREWRPLVIAHRGQPAQVPENTLESFARSVDLGAELIEGDVQLTCDGRLAMMHGDPGAVDERAGLRRGLHLG
jgi:glycerophosphoryl diester phosphodiesterase